MIPLLPLNLKLVFLLLFCTSVSAQEEPDWKLSYNTAGIKQGGFVNVSPANHFGRGLVGVYLGFHKEAFYYNVEVDFLAGGYRKLFKRLSHPNFQFNVCYAVYRISKLEIQAGMSTSYRMDMIQRDRLTELSDTLNMDYTGTTSSLSFGPVVRCTYLLGGRSRLFSELGLQLSYSFDVFAHGNVQQEHGALKIDGKIPGPYREQRDAFTLELRLGIGQYSRKKAAPVYDPELEIETP